MPLEVSDRSVLDEQRPDDRQGEAAFDVGVFAPAGRRGLLVEALMRSNRHPAGKIAPQHDVRFRFGGRTGHPRHPKRRFEVPQYAGPQARRLRQIRRFQCGAGE
jgi:hypothetical protein